MPASTPRAPSPGKRQAPRRQARRRRRRPTPARLFRLLIPILVLAVILGVVVNLVSLHRSGMPSWVDQQLIQGNGTGRRGDKLDAVNSIVIHYVGNPGTTAQQNHDYYDQPDTTVSSHFLIGLDGEIIQCVPIDEKSSASNDRNSDTLSIEVCHPDATGQFTQASYDSLVKLTAWLCDHCHIGRDQVIRHYDITGKLCPLYFVENPAAWEQFLADVKNY